MRYHDLSLAFILIREVATMSSSVKVREGFGLCSEHLSVALFLYVRVAGGVKFFSY